MSLKPAPKKLAVAAKNGTGVAPAKKGKEASSSDSSDSDSSDSDDDKVSIRITAKGTEYFHSWILHLLIILVVYNMVLNIWMHFPTV